MSLSEKIIKLTDEKECNWKSCILRDDVKEFIKEILKHPSRENIRKEAGKDLI